MERSDISAVVVSYNSARWLPACVDAVLAAGLAPERLVVVDDASSDGSADLVRQRCPRVRVVRSATNLGFGGVANLGIRQSATDTVVVLNPDVVVGPGTLVALGRALAREPQAAVAGGKLLFPDGKTIQHAGGTLSYPLALADHYGYGEEDRGQCDEPREVEFVTGALFAVRRSVLDEIGYFDEGFYPAYFEDSDLCFRARQAGYKVLYVPDAVATHHESATTGRDTPEYYRLYHRSRVRFVLKHYSREQLWCDFLPAETALLRQSRSEGERAALAGAYADNLHLLGGLADCTTDAGGGAALAGSDARREVLTVLKWVANLVERRLLDEEGELRPAAEWSLAEPKFVSQARVVGPAIVAVRAAWNWMSTKWYVQPIIQQQSEINARFVRALRELQLTLGAMEAGVVETERASTRLHGEMALIDSRLRRLEQQVADTRRLLEAPSRRYD